MSEPGSIGNVFYTRGPQYWYRSVGHLVPGRTERINNLHYFRFIYYLSLNDVLF